MFSMIVALILVNPASLSASRTTQIQKVEKRLLAPCCYTQSIAEHGSAIAVQMRGEVSEMVAEGKSESAIVGHSPMMAAPVAIAALACIVLFVCFRKMLRSGRLERTRDVSQSRPVLSDALKEKIEREIGEPL
jgi:cytochrome c-type biogenesis protein CcmH/NrfF